MASIPPYVGKDLMRGNYVPGFSNMMGGLSGIGSILGSILGNSDWKNPADAGMPFIEGAAGKMSPYFDPFIQAGLNQLPGLNQQFGNLVNDPSGFLNNLGQGYQKSPGFDFNMQQAMQAADHAAAAGGMAGSPQHQQQAATLANNLASQDYNNWLSKALGTYQLGLGGMGNIFNTGAQMGADFGNSLGNLELQKALLAYQGQDAANKNEGSMWGNILGSVAQLAPLFLR